MAQEAYTHDGAGTVTVTGAGAAEAAPDLVLASLGVESRAGSVQEAYAAAGRAMDAVAGALRSSGVSPADIRTAGLGVRADLAWRDGEGQKVVGYVAVSSLAVRLRELAGASAAVSEAVRAGGDAARLNSLQLMLSDESTVRAAARDAAWQDARGAAAQFAALASATLGRVLSVTDRPAAPSPVPAAGLQRAAATESMAVEPGMNRVEAAVTVTWELLPMQEDH